MKKNEVGCLIYPSCRGIQYLAGFESFDFASALVPYFSLTPSCAFPLTDKQADFVLSRIDFDIRKRLKFALYPKQDCAPDIFELEHSPLGGVI